MFPCFAAGVLVAADIFKENADSQQWTLLELHFGANRMVYDGSFDANIVCLTLHGVVFQFLFIALGSGRVIAVSPRGTS